MALVLGAVLLFGILAAIMIVTRRVDWYRIAARDAGQDILERAAFLVQK